jgi:type I restriction enzyme, S subunit
MANCVPYSVYKKSEIEWLGAIPRHWNIVQLRHVLTGPLKNGLFKKKDRWGQGYKIVNVFDAYVNGDVVDENSLDRVICSESEFLKYSVQHGTLSL